MNKKFKIGTVILTILILFSAFGTTIVSAEENVITPYYTEIREFVKTESSKVTSVTISKKDIITRQYPKHIISVAKGQTITTSINTSITFNYSCSAQAAIDAAIKGAFNLSTGASITLNFTGSNTFTGPSSPYSTRDYYAAVAYDQYKITLSNRNQYHVYRIDGGKKTLVRTEYATVTETVYANIPHKQMYSIDS